MSFGNGSCSQCPFASCVWCCVGSSSFPFDTDDVEEIPLIVQTRTSAMGKKRSMTMVAASIVTVVMFATSNVTVNTFGDIGIISLLFLVFMCGTGLLTEADFNSMSWHTLCLIGGGDVLGKAVASSGLWDMSRTNS